MDGEKSKTWSIELGFYPGILFGVRNYEMEDEDLFVIYLPLIDIAFRFDK